MRRVIWGRKTSSNVMKVIWAAGELELPFERIDVGGAFGKTDTAEYRAMNPTGLVPTLQEDAFSLWESNVICRYLCHAHAPHSALWPQDPRHRAVVDRWMDAQQTILNRPMTVVFWGLVRTPPAERDEQVIGQAIQDTAKVWRIVEDQLAQHPYLAGPAFTLADIPWGVHAHRWFNMDFERPAMPALQAWYEKLCDRPAYHEHVSSQAVV